MQVMVALSGGVDSAVAARLLIDDGYDVAAMFMKNWEEDDQNGECPTLADVQDAQGVADKLGIKLHRVNFSDEYWNRVFATFIAEFKKGRTPNPDVLCNREIKFKVFLDYAQSLGADKIATGHYARLTHNNQQYRLHKGLDDNKDQSYFLHQLAQDQLSRAMFPLGELTKQQVRAIAHRAGFLNADKKDSTGICFIGEKNFKQFLAQYIHEQAGDMLTTDGVKIGTHDGLSFYTLGQRQGLGIGGLKDYSEEPWYVLDKDFVSNTLIVGQDSKHELLQSRRVIVENPHFITEKPSSLPYNCHAKTRYRQADAPCTITELNEKQMTVIFNQPQLAVTPGQSLVLYQDDECLGGGIICARKFT